MEKSFTQAKSLVGVYVSKMSHLLKRVKIRQVSFINHNSIKTETFTIVNVATASNIRQERLWEF